ncbi:MAG: hypothetical protein FWD31_08830 [Planctomycetaceae bacterium]|nr:hypothetical protein [Planctomycetaceae bacterium]
MNNPAFFPIESLTADPDLQIRVKINEETISLYAEQMATEDEMMKFPAVEIYYDGTKYWLADGHHRRAAAEKAGHDNVWAVVKSGTRADALWGAILGNGKQGFGLTRADKQRAIILAIVEWPDRSNVMLAEAIGCGESTIRRYREQKTTSPNGDVDNLRRIGRDGKTRPAKKKTKTKSSSKPDSTDPLESQETSDSLLEQESDVAVSETSEQQTEPSFRPGSLPTKKYVGETQLKPIPRDRPDILVGNLIAFFPQEFIPNTAREIFRMLHDRYGMEVTKPLAVEFYQQYGRRKK